MLRSIAVFAPLAAATLLTVASRDAAACAPPRCQPAVFPVQSAPAGLTALPFRPDTGLTGEEAWPTLIRAADGATLTGQITVSGYDSVFSFAEPLTPGDYTLRYRNGCSPSDLEVSDRAFTVTAEAPLPTAAGELRVLSSSRETISVATVSGSCYADADAAIVKLELITPAELAPYRDVVAYTTTVDGNHWATSGVVFHAARSTLQLYAACDDRTVDRGRDHGLMPGSHVVEVTPRIVGHTQPIAPARLRVTVSCDDTNGQSEPIVEDSGDGGSSGAPGPSSSSGGSSSGTSAEVDGDDAAADPPIAASGGCSTHGSSPTVWATLSGVALLVVRRLQRKRG